MPSGQGRACKPYYYDCGSKSACVELHLFASSKTEPFFGTPRRRCRKHSYVSVTGFVCQGWFRALVTGKARGPKQRARKLIVAFFRVLHRELRAVVLEQRASTPSGNSLHCTWTDDHGCSAFSHRRSCGLRLFSHGINRLRSTRNWIDPCIDGIEPLGGIAMIVYLMLGVLAALTFLCVSPLISRLASRKPGPAKPSQPRPIRKSTLPAR